MPLCSSAEELTILAARCHLSRCRKGHILCAFNAIYTYQVEMHLISLMTYIRYAVEPCYLSLNLNCVSTRPARTMSATDADGKAKTRALALATKS